MKRTYQLELLNSLPTPIVHEVRDMLGAYDNCTVWRRSDGTYYVATFSVVSASDKDEEYIGAFRSIDILSDDEITMAYIANFKSYPAGYEGDQDFTLMDRLRKMPQDIQLRSLEMVGKTVNIRKHNA